ncbi:MAG: hypothetical protein F9B45_09085 [Phycisphaera sp. RhM]|nr:hypothetical protein [Phycisphaera sp. RhM]
MPREFHVVRWRFFINNCWLASTAGISIYIGTLLLGYPYGWIALLYVLKYALWSLKDMTNLRVILTSGGIEGPGFMFISTPRFLAWSDIDASRTGIRGGRFFIEGNDGTSITSRLFWYDSEAQKSITAFVSSVNPATYLNLTDVLRGTG